MEMAGIYLLSNIIRHDAASLSAMLVNHITGKFSGSHDRVVDNLIRVTLGRL